MAKLISMARPTKIDEFITHLRTPLYRNGYALMVSTGLTSVLGLLYWAIAARVYQTDQVGLNSMAISVMIFLSGVAQLNLQEAMIRFIPRAGKRTLRLAVYTYGIVIALSLLVGLLFCLGIPLWTPALTFLVGSPSAIVPFVLVMVLWGIFVIEDSILIGLRQALYIPVENAIFAILKIAFLLLLAVVLPQTGIFFSWTISVVLVIIPINWLIFKRLIPKYVKAAPVDDQTPSLLEMSKYVAANYIAALLASLSSAILPVIITQVAGATANAHFYLAWIIASSLQIVAANMSTSLTVEATLAGENQEQYRRRALIGIARIVLPLVVLLVLGAPLILRIVGPDYADEGTLLLQLLALSAIPNLFNMVYVGIARAQNHIRSIVWVYGANAVLVLVFSYAFLQSFGITGVGLAWVISQTLIAAALLISSRRNARRDTLSKPGVFSVSEQRLDTFVCVHQRDVGYLLELVLRSYEVNFRPKGKLTLISNDLPYLRDFCERLGVAQGATFSSDNDWLSKRELSLPGWYRQQIIKLRSYQFCETTNLCNLGADTVLLQPIEADDLVSNGFPILYYTSHRFPDQHVRFERERIAHLGPMLQTTTPNAERYVDFINDLFCFNRDALHDLSAYLVKLYGDEPFDTLLHGFDDASTSRNKFGEWTLYSIYLLDVLKRNVVLRDTRPDFLYQIHSKLALRAYRFNTKVAHFVGKDFDINYIKQQIAKRSPELDQSLA